jgi:alpha-ketoglutarate-dependent taurine dioxygenase
VQEYCSQYDITCDWIDDKLLRTAGIAQGVTTHPKTREKVFFNQAHLFHVSSLGPIHAEALVSMYGVNRLPRHARFGDGTEIPDLDLRRVSDAFKKSAITFRWQKGDVLVLDNVSYAHGRRPFKGSRKVLAALMDPSSDRLIRAIAL